MTIVECLRLVPAPERVGRDAWKSRQDALYLYKGRVLFRVRPNTEGWAWTPNLDDLLAEDWAVK